MIVRDDKGNFVGLACDECGVPAPPALEIMQAFGLQNRGWYCSGGTHLCAEHSPEPTHDIGPMLAGETVGEYHKRTGLSA